MKTLFERLTIGSKLKLENHSEYPSIKADALNALLNNSAFTNLTLDEANSITTIITGKPFYSMDQIFELL